MSAAAMILALLAIAFALVAFWRVGLRQDIEGMQHQLRREIEALRARQAELIEGVSRSVGASIDAGRRSLAGLAHDLARLEKEADADVAALDGMEGMDGSIQRLQQHFIRLSRALEEAAKSTRDTTLATAQEQGRALMRRVHRFAARLALVEVKVRAHLAAQAAARGDFELADRRLAAAAERLADARSSLGGENEDAIAEVRGDLAAASASVLARAGDVQARLERLMADAERLAGSLGGDESEREEPMPAAAV